MRFCLFIIVFLILCSFIFASGDQEFVVTETMLVDDFDDGDYMSELGAEWGFYRTYSDGSVEDLTLPPLKKPGIEGSAYALEGKMKIYSPIIYYFISLNFTADEKPIG